MGAVICGPMGTCVVLFCVVANIGDEDVCVCVPETGKIVSSGVCVCVCVVVHVVFRVLVVPWLRI